MRAMPAACVPIALAVLLFGCVGAGAGSGPTASPATPAPPTAAPTTTPPTPTPTPAPSATMIPVEGRTFLSTAVTESGVDRALVKNTRIRMQFVDGRVVASAGCNTMSGVYSSVGRTLRVDALITTEIGCDPARHAQDGWLGTFLSAGPTLALDGVNLVMEQGETDITLVDRKVAEPDLSLVGPTWTVESVIDGDSAASFVGLTAILVFSEDSRVRIDTGCNTGAATYVLDAAAKTIRFSEIALTKRACTDGPGQMETAVLAVLGADSVTYGIESSLLTLAAGRRGLQLTGKQGP